MIGCVHIPNDHHGFVWYETIAPSAQRVVLAYCEGCRILFPTSREDVRSPGDFIGLQRGAGQRPPLLCDGCVLGGEKPELSLKQAAEVKAIANEIRAQRQRAMPPREVFHTVKHDVHSQQKARRKWCSWKVPLMEAFQTKGELTAREISEIMKQGGGNAVHNARTLGFPIVALYRKVVEINGRVSSISMYGLSNSEDPRNMPPRDSNGHFLTAQISV